MAITRILVPTDFSGPSDAALDYARMLAARFHASLQLLHVLEPALAATLPGAEASLATLHLDRDAVRRDAEQQLAERIDEADRRMLGATTKVLPGLGPVARVIVDYAASANVDLIVMGTHGRRGLAHVLMGSVAERVVQTAACPVLTARIPPAKEAAAGNALSTAVA